MEIRAIFFDLGNVLLAFDWNRAAARIRERSDLSRREIAARLMRSPFRAYELGRLSTRDFFGELGLALNFRGSTRELQRVCSDIFSPMHENIALARELSANYLLGIISNTNPAHIEFEEAHHDFFKAFAARIYSYEVHSLKPDRAIYDAALCALDLGAGESLIIDDREENVRAARELGWHGVHLKPDTKLREELRGFGVRGI